MNNSISGMVWICVFLVMFSSCHAFQMISSSPQRTMMSMSMSNEKVAVVTGASRGIGRGIALELGRAGYTVYCLGRSSRENKGNKIVGQRAVAPELELTVESIAEEITSVGGTGVPMVCDLAKDGSIESVLDVVNEKENGRLDVLVCSAYTTPTTQSLRGDFWTQGLEMWDDLNGVGLRQVYAACCKASPLLINTASNNPDGTTPCICLVSSFGGMSYTFNVAYGVGKAAIDRLAKDMAVQLKSKGVATLALYPGLVQTEANLQMVVDGTWDEASGNLDLNNFGESTAFSGVALTKLLSLQPKTELMKRSGSVQVVAELAKEFNFVDPASNTQPPSIRSLKYLLPNFVFPSIEKQGGKIPNFIKNNIPDYLVPWSTFSSGPPPEQE